MHSRFSPKRHTRQFVPNMGQFARMALTIVAIALICGCNESSSSNSAARLEEKSSTMPAKSDGTNVLPGMQASPLDTTNVARGFSARGVIRQLSSDRKTFVVKHEDIPGFMPRMTMEFDVRSTNELAGLTVGDVITFVVRASDRESWVEEIRRAGTNDPSAAIPAEPSSSALLHIAKLKPGDVMSDAELLAEDGKTIRLSNFSGKALAFTFIFTRCPLPDFCPRMSQHFSRARELLASRHEGPTNWQFLSISFDPEFDKPGVLTRYAYSYRGKNQDRWLFAAAANDVMTSFSSKLDFRFADEGGSFLHNLRTVVVDRNGRVHRQFDGNKWSAEELAQAMAEAAESSLISTNQSTGEEAKR